MVLEVISVLIALIIYLIAFQLLFEGFDDFKQKLKDSMLEFALHGMLQSLFNWSPVPNKFSFRIMFWIVSGILGGVIFYTTLKI